MPPLDPASCALLRDDRLVARYNAVHDLLEQAAKALPRFGEREVVVELRGELARVAEMMQKKRFAIGFIGPSQAGKSATVSNLLSVSGDDAPTAQGSSGPTTSVPTRTVPTPPGAGVENTITLHYFSRAQFQERVRDICDLVKIRFDDDLQRIREAALEKRRDDPYTRAGDIDVLVKLIDAALAFPEMLTEAGRDEKGLWKDRRLYTTHQNKPSPYTLLREVSIQFVTDAMSPEIETIDLPGIDVSKGSDARLTLGFVRDLDGAFMFQGSHQVMTAAVAELAERMRESHGRTLGERIWMVITRCDALNDLQVNGPADQPDQPTMFCHLSEIMRQQGVKPDNVHFIGNEYHRERLKAGLGERDAPSDPLVQRFPSVLRFDAGGQPVVPAHCGRTGAQAEPWRQFVLNGGIPALRETMQTRVAESVRTQTRGEVARRLTAVVERLVSALMAAEQQSSMTVDEMVRAARWSGEIDRLSDEVGRDSRYSSGVATAIGDTLGSLIAEWGSIDADGLPETHRQMAGLLAQAGLQEAVRQTSLVVAAVKTRLEERSAAQPPPSAAGLATPLEHWAAAVTKCIDLGRTSDGRDFRGPIFTSFRDDPSPLGDAGHGMTVADYPLVMRSKAARVARVYGSRLVGEIQAHLARLQQRYRALGTEIERIDSGQRELYAKFRADLEPLRN